MSVFDRSIFDQSIYGSVVWMRCSHRLDQTSLFDSTASSSLGSRLNWTAVVEFNSTHFLFFSLSLSAFQLIERITTSEMHTAPSKLFRNFWLQLQLISIWFTMRSFDNVAFHLLFLRQRICTFAHTAELAMNVAYAAAATAAETLHRTHIHSSTQIELHYLVLFFVHFSPNWLQT